MPRSTSGQWSHPWDIKIRQLRTRDLTGKPTPSSLFVKRFFCGEQDKTGWRYLSAERKDVIWDNIAEMHGEVWLQKGLLSAVSCSEEPWSSLEDQARLAVWGPAGRMCIRSKWAEMGNPATSMEPSDPWRNPGLLTWGVMFVYIRICLLYF